MAAWTLFFLRGVHVGKFTLSLFTRLGVVDKLKTKELDIFSAIAALRSKVFTELKSVPPEQCHNEDGKSKNWNNASTNEGLIKFW